MTLAEILSGITARLSGSATIEITGISYDSRKVQRGHLFFALPGGKIDGRNFIGDAVRKGAVAVVYQRPEAGKGIKVVGGPATCVEVEDGREALALAACNFFSQPSRVLWVAGITGTNGKTTTSYILKSILESWGKKVGLVGTIQYMIADKIYDAPHTTPEAADFQELLNAMRLSGCSHAVSEVSSHALAQKRVEGTLFKTAIFTNLTRDHLDYHKTMDDYFLAKSKLFDELLAEDGVPIINSDDLYGSRLISSIRQKSRTDRVCTYGLEKSSDIMAAGITNSVGGLRFNIITAGKSYPVVSPLLGLPNVYNILSAAGAAAGMGAPWETILAGIRNAGTVRGRFEKVDAGQKFLAVVDYAHTEDALERLIYTAKGMTRGRIITVFGCGGDRDRGKRPRMGEIATRLSDFVIITADNPRSEDPAEIIKETIAGAVRKNFLAEVDRKEAIKRAVLMADKGDIVLIAGKGHETYQEIGSERIRFNDREVLEEAIKQLTNRK